MLLVNEDQPQEGTTRTATVARPPEALEALGGAIERGRHVALVAAEGAGLGRLYAAATARDLAACDDEGGRAFVLAASVERARRLAGRMHEAARAAGNDVVVIASGVTSEAARRAAIVVGPPAPVLEAIRRGEVPASAICSLVVDDVRTLAPAREAVEAVLQASGEGARRVVTTHARDAAFDEFVRRWLPRARCWPPELFAEPGGEAPGAGREAAGPIAVATRATRQGRLARLAELLHEIARDGAATAVSVETDPAAVADVRAALATAGYGAAGGAGPAVRVGTWGEVEPGAHAIIFELPPTPAFLARTAASADRCAAIVDALHERQFELTAARAGLAVAALGEPLDESLLDDIAAFRTRIADAIERHDPASGALLLAPLIEEHGAARVAGALAGLLRAADRAAARPEQRTPDRPVDRAGTTPDAGRGDTRPDSATRRATRPTWTRIFVGVGKRDGAGPGDLVGAITGETPAAGGQVGRIDVRLNFSLVDIDSLVVDEVVRALDGQQIKGRQVVVRLDRRA